MLRSLWPLSYMSRRASAASGPPAQADIYNWWDPTAGVAATAGKITTWTDKVASLALPSTDGGAGSVTTSTINGAPAIQCLSSNGFYANDTFSHADATVTFALVASFNGILTSGRILSVGNVGADWNNTQAFGFMRSGATDDVTLWHNGSNMGAIDVGGTYGTTFVAFIEVNTTTIKLWINNVLAGTLTDASLNLGDFHDLGLFRSAASGNEPDAGKLGDVIVYNRVLTGAEQTDLYNYLKAKYSL